MYDATKSTAVDHGSRRTIYQQQQQQHQQQEQPRRIMQRPWIDVRPWMRDLVGPLWTLFFAMVAILDILSCSETWNDGWMEGRSKQNGGDEPQQRNYSWLRNLQGESNDTEICPATAEEDWNCPTTSTTAISSSACASNPTMVSMLVRMRIYLMQQIQQDWGPTIGLLFCILCIMESIRKARVARQMALDLAALDEFEHKLARLYSATKLNRIFRSTSFNLPFRTPNDAGDGAGAGDGESGDVAMMRRYIRPWAPILATLVGWSLILPWPMLIPFATMPGGGYSTCGMDPALATVWITQCTHHLATQYEYYSDRLVTGVWKVVLPFNLLHPILLIQRLRLLSRWVRYVRYGGPLLRLLLKLQDQFWVFGKTWKQTWTVQTERAKRLASRSLLLEDIQRIESLTKFQTAIASLPSPLFVFHNNNKLLPPTNNQKAVVVAAIPRTTTTTVPLTIATSTISSTDSDTEDLVLTTPTTINATSSGSLQPSTTAATATATTQGVAVLIAQKQQEGKRLKQRLHDLKKHARASSRVFPTSELYDSLIELTQEVTTQVQSAVWNAHLISPRTRFSVVWRLIVTLCLLSELGRLYTSWQLSGTFELRFRDLTVQLLGVCQQQSRPIRGLLGKVMRLPPKHIAWLDNTCQQSSWSSQVSLQLAQFSEWAIDLVGFLDIVVWFYTGDLDVNGLVVPKAFFTRCILPGTLVQVLDHPTVPQVIPRLLAYTWTAMSAVGYSRILRWGWALVPALDLMIWHPIHQYLFHPMNRDEFFNYTESLALIHRGGSSSGVGGGKNSSSSGALCSSTSRLLGKDSSSRYHGHNQSHVNLLVTATPPLSPIIGGEGTHHKSVTMASSPSSGGVGGTTMMHNTHASMGSMLHASISENDGYGLYY